VRTDTAPPDEALGLVNLTTLPVYRVANAAAAYRGAVIDQEMDALAEAVALDVMQVWISDLHRAVEERAGTLNIADGAQLQRWREGLRSNRVALARHRHQGLQRLNTALAVVERRRSPTSRSQRRCSRAPQIGRTVTARRSMDESGSGSVAMASTRPQRKRNDQPEDHLTPLAKRTKNEPWPKFGERLLGNGLCHDDRLAYGWPAVVTEVVRSLGEPYSNYYVSDRGLSGGQELAFVQAAGMIALPPASYPMTALADRLREYGPLWIIAGDGIRSHARLLVGIYGAPIVEKLEAYRSTIFEFIDPSTGTYVYESALDFMHAFEREAAYVVEREDTTELRWQILHWPS